MFLLRLVPGRVRAYVYKNRSVFKRAIVVVRSLLPARMAKHLILWTEKAAFSFTPAHQTDTLPPIFIYWATKFIKPKFEKLGASSPEDLYFTEIVRSFAVPARSNGLQLASFGCGACELEARLSRRLLDAGIDSRIDCIDINSGLLEIGKSNAANCGVEGRLNFIVADCSSYVSESGYDAIIVNQFFHHVDALEQFCEVLEKSLLEDGLLLSSDVVGRNGHVLWPSVAEDVQIFWRELAEDKKIDRADGRIKSQYESVDHSAYSNEGVRAQDVVESLLKRFDFDLFLTFGAVVMPFVERRFGFNFSADSGDTEFIDRVAIFDEERSVVGAFPGSNMFAVLRKKGKANRKIYDPISPSDHVRLTKEQLFLALDPAPLRSQSRGS